MAKVSGINMEITADTSSAEKDLRQLNKDLRGGAQYGRALNKALELDPESIEIADKKLQHLTEQEDLAQKKAELIKQKLDAIGDADIDTSEVQKLNAQLLRTENQIKEIENEKDKLTKKPTKVGVDVDTSGGKNISMWATAAAAATTAVLGLGKATDTLAKRQQMVNAVFGEGTETLGAYSTAAATSLGVVAGEFEKVAASMAVTAQNSGMAAEESQKYGIAVAQLSAVLSSYLGLPLEETAERVSAAMRGEAESAEALGLTLNETTVANYAMANGANKAWSEMSAQEQMSWRLAAAITQVATMMGVEVEAVTDATTAMNGLMAITSEAEKNTSEFSKTIATLREGLAELLVAIQPIVNAFFLFINTVIEITTEFWTWFASLENVQKALKALGAIVVGVGVGIVALITIVTTAIQRFVEWWNEAVLLQYILEEVKKIVEALINIVSSFIENVKEIVGWFVAWAEESWLVQTALAAIEMVVGLIATGVAFLVTAVENVITWFSEWYAEAGLLQRVLEAIATAVETISSAIETMIGWINSAIEAFQNFREQDFGTGLINMGGPETEQAMASGVSAMSASTNSAMMQFAQPNNVSNRKVFSINNLTINSAVKDIDKLVPELFNKLDAYAERIS